ncbi:proline-rich nuclear receptor coactivator 1 isoform X3 [Chanodichthys erythropterus]|uniref:proline-rich nuclear receptor coactivator 1 isoform X3 n=1 Tax=Chanodichthys erythropterus TaxID=933992 RepID=UPI00351DE9D5
MKSSNQLILNQPRINRKKNFIQVWNNMRLKSKTECDERGSQSSRASVHSSSRLEQTTENLNKRRQSSKQRNMPDNTQLAKRHQNSMNTEKSPLYPAEGLKRVNACPSELSSEADKTYAGAKFSEPPSPSVLPKPPRHWVGDCVHQHTAAQHNCSKEQMSEHLKTLLKVQAEP